MSQKATVKQPKLIFQTMPNNCKYKPVAFINTEEVQTNTHVYTPNEQTSIIVRKATWFERLFK